MDEDDVVTFQDLEAAKATHQAGDTVTLTVFRNGEKLELSLTLDEQPRETVTDTSSSSNSSLSRTTSITAGLRGIFRS